MPKRTFFRTGATLDIKWRLNQLRKLRDAVISHEREFKEALHKDLGRSTTEAYLCDIGPIEVEINEMLRGLRRWARPERHFSGLMCFPSLVTKVYKIPYGVILVISPFNFPILLTLGVVAASICGGNTVVVKASAKSRHCTEVMKQFISEVFPAEFVTLIDGGHDVADMCLNRGCLVFVYFSHWLVIFSVYKHLSFLPGVIRFFAVTLITLLICVTVYCFLKKFCKGALNVLLGGRLKTTD